MRKIVENVTELIGNTPLFKPLKTIQQYDLQSSIFLKLESFNPGGSVKDRIALAMVEDAEEKGILHKGVEIIEATSGNTGIGLAMVAANRGYGITLTMPETMSIERRNLLKAFGAKIVLTPGGEGMKGAISKAKELEKALGGIILQQFENKANPAIHTRTTAEEIWRDTDGKVDIFVAGVGTGGTVSGVGKRLKELNPKVQIIAVEPSTSAVLSGKPAGSHKIQGIGAGFIPSNYDSNVVDEVLLIDDDNAIGTSRALAKQEGLLVGISAGASTYAAIQLGKRPENKDKNIVALLPDTGERYLSTVLYAFDEYPLES